MDEKAYDVGTERALESLETPHYLAPYLDAARRHGGGFESLLWASRATQARRFDAIVRLAEFDARRVLDVGCGRAELLDYLIGHGMSPSRYVGLEAVAALAETAAKHPNDRDIRAEIVRADFVRDPRAMRVGADVIVCSGSLNTLDRPAFYATLEHAFAAAGEMLVFNFLSSPCLAGRPFLSWHGPDEVLRICGQMCGDVRSLDDYLEGDCTIALRKDVMHQMTGTSE
jgi:SAM-dependent methyltransferase